MVQVVLRTVVVGCLVAGCAIEQEISRTPRTAVEQLLLTQAVTRALKNLTLTLPPQAPVYLEVSGFYIDRARLTMRDQVSGDVQDPTVDFLFVRDTVAVALGRMGYRIRRRDEQPAYLARVSIESLGTMQGLTFIGMPPVQSVLIPFALPELTLINMWIRAGMPGFISMCLIMPPGNTKAPRSPSSDGRPMTSIQSSFFFTWVDTDMTAPP